MDFKAAVDFFLSLHTFAKIILTGLPLVFTCAICLRRRLWGQATYCRILFTLGFLPKYYAKREMAWAILGISGRRAILATEERLAKEIGVNLGREVTGLGSIWHPLDHAYLADAIERLRDATYSDLLCDLVNRMLIWIDDLVDMEQQDRGYRFAADKAQHEATRKVLVDREGEDRVRLAQHIQLMQQYIEGKLRVDLISERSSATLRLVLDEKYRVYMEFESSSPDVG